MFSFLIYGKKLDVHKAKAPERTIRRENLKWQSYFLAIDLSFHHLVEFPMFSLTHGKNITPDS